MGIGEACAPVASGVGDRLGCSMRDKPFHRLADLQQMATRVQTSAHASLIRECAHKEY
jgi:hypothetical protein